MHRSEFLKALSVTTLFSRITFCEETAPESNFNREFLAGAKVLNNAFWLPEISNWLDRPGKSLRDYFEGRVNSPWWSSANAVETLSDYMDVSRTNIFEGRLNDLHAGNVVRGSRLTKVKETLRDKGPWSDADEERFNRRMKTIDPNKVRGTEFRNEYLDDSGWWGIAWLKFYGRTSNPAHLKTAVAIQRHMAANWREDGGVSWAEDADKRAANSITNSLFVILSARLHGVTHQPEYLEWAVKGMDWQKKEKLYDGIAVVDRPGHRNDYWTYNQGAYLGAFEALHFATGKTEYLEEAADVAKTILHKSGIVRDDGVLFEKLPGKGWDVCLFKGICARYLGILSRSLKRNKIRLDTAKELSQVLQASASSILKTSKQEGLYPLEWHEPSRFQVYNFNTQLSAMIAFCAEGESMRS
jgi:predicted alpha-1,6-mannanase (GH76 family)